MTAREERVRSLVDGVARSAGVAPRDVHVVRAPYRFCPIGAHVDHQGGEVTGIALDRALHLAFVPRADDEVRLRSESEERPIAFRLGEVPDAIPGDWGNYARGAARALGADHELRTGITGAVTGEMAPGGVSTSAALGVACLLALEVANELDVDPVRNVELDRRIENDYLGLANGILDQSVILRARRDALFHLDCRSGRARWHETPASLGEPAFLAIHSGVEVALTGTGYNARVAECRRAATQLLEGRGLPVPHRPVLSDVPSPVGEDELRAVGGPAERRARHYFGEMSRVARGVDAWREGDLPRFADIVTETGRSSIDLYECGSPELIRLFELLLADTAVLGARFSGAGFRGYAMAITRSGDAETAGTRVMERYVREHPALAPRVHLHVCRPGRAAEVT